MTPLFSDREQLIIHDECYQVMCSNFEFLNLRLKNKEIESKIGKKVLKPILKLFGYNPPSCKNDIELDYYMQDQLKLTFEESESGLTLDMDKRCFIDQFREEHSYLWLLHRSFFMIERGKKFKLAVIALCCLLRNRIYFKERGHWWHRLGMNLKHLKLKHQAFKAMNLALKDEFVAGEKLNLVLKYRL